VVLADRVIKNSIALWISEAFNIIVNLFAVAIVARYLGVERFGDYGFVLAVCNIFQVLTDMGTKQVFVREVARNPEDVQEYFTANLLTMTILGILVFLLIIASIYFFPSSKHLLSPAAIGAVAVILLFFSQLFSAVFQAFEKMKYEAFMRSLSYSIYLAVIVLAVRFDSGITGIFIALLIQNVTACIAGYGFTRKYFFKPKFTLNRARFIEVFREGLPIGFTFLLRKISYRVDILFLKAFSSLTDLGLFNGIYRINLQLQFIPRNATNALFPVFSRLSKDKESKFMDVQSRSVKFLLIGFIPILAILMVFPKEVISLILGKEFVKAVSLMRILTLSLGFQFLSILFIRTLYALNKQRLAILCVAACLTANILGDILLIPTWGYIGAGIATLVAETVLFLLTGLSVARYLNIRSLLGAGAKLIIAGMVMSMLWIGFGGKALLFSLILGVLSYPLLLWILHVLDDQESAWFRDIIKRLFSHSEKMA
jgi:O-antigen/teichoic acid export membrane protein